MKLPTTTPENPYVEFRFSKTGKLTLTAVSNYYGGINSGFSSSDGSMGNTCLPKDLDRYIAKYKQRKIKEVEKEISDLNKKLQNLKQQFSI